MLVYEGKTNGVVDNYTGWKLRETWREIVRSRGPRCVRISRRRSARERERRLVWSLYVSIRENREILAPLCSLRAIIMSEYTLKHPFSHSYIYLSIHTYERHYVYINISSCVCVFVCCEKMQQLCARIYKQRVFLEAHTNYKHSEPRVSFDGV